MVPSDYYGQVWEHLSAEAVLLKAGANVVTTDRADLTIPRLASDSVASWTGENSEITEPLREGNLIGNGPEVLQRIDALGNDFEFGPPGTCGKDGQGVPVGDGVPTLRVSALTVGGTAAA